jgi:hypothetical protein
MACALPNGTGSWLNCAARSKGLGMTFGTRISGITVGDLAGKLTVLRVECSKCGRFGRYPLRRLIDRRGHDARIIDWLEELTADCPRKRAASVSDQCTRGAPICRRWCNRHRPGEWPVHN